ncbi:MAG: M4 family metallopeptidase [Saprospiraceae bacterium]|jgi:Zn-dependent metalloprotease|nr:M4 family metallopeptidase [Saprospiraceae bacterium]
MKKVISLLVLLVSLAAPSFAQHNKTRPSATGKAPENPQVSWPGKAVVPLATNPFGVATPRPKPLPMLQTSLASGQAEVSIVRGENGLPIFFEGKTEASGNASESKPIGERALEYCASLQPQGITAPEVEFVLQTAQTDEQGNAHVRLEQVYNGLPVWGGEVICHTKSGAFERMNGRYFPTPKLSTIVPAISADAAILKVKTEIGVSKIKTDWSASDLKLIDGQPFTASLIVFHPKETLTGERLSWHVAARPNVLSRSEWFVDAITGEVLNQFEHTCNLTGHLHNAMGECSNHASPNPQIFESPTEDEEMETNVNGIDLLGVNRSFINGGWQNGGQFLLEDASKTMFNPSSSNMPNDPVGVIVTLDAFNTSPENQNFTADFVVSNSATFTNKAAAISGHYNSIKSFDYFFSKFNRESIDGEGGNVISIVNVSEANSTSMENAFWNGQAMFYGNGGSTFKPLARGLDVGGHEMTHGVIEKTANLIYENESGALNESFADVFGQMIDGDLNDWKIGEDVMQSGGGLPSALRDLSNPHNGQASNSPFWQPNHTNEQVMGSNDNGGVHANSGIANRAFFLFASDASVGTTKAEQVYYKALRDYLVKSSKFVDCRLAVIQAATDLYGAAVANVAANAFATVGIGGSVPSGNYLGQLNPNPGTEFILCASDDGSDLDLASSTGQVLGSLYTQGVKSRPSISDNGIDLVFVNDAGHIIGISMNYQTNPITFSTFQLSDNPEWGNAAISKDGRFVAGITDFEQPRIYVYDLASPFGESETFYLYNPTYSQGQITGDVQYADVLEFDYSGEYLMYDAYNDLDGVGYWDIGFVRYWENDQFTDGGNAFITKLFTGLPEKVSINNPAIAKNSPFIIAFDLIDEIGTPRNDIYGANSETGDYDAIIIDNGVLGWPNYNRLDNKLLYEKANGVDYNLRVQGLQPNKIQALGNSSQIVSFHYWGVNYANGIRNLQVGTNDVTSQNFEVKISPNPTVDFAQLTLRANDASEAIISVHNLLGETLMTRSVNILEGENQLDIDLQNLPSGNYVVRVAAENGAGAALKLVKI